MKRRILCVIIWATISGYAVADDSRVRASSGFETGKIQNKDDFYDGWNVRTLPDPQRGDEIIGSGSGGCGPDSNCDVRVVRSENVGGETVKPRRGNYFVRMALHYDKDYSGLNGGKDKPRGGLHFGANDPAREYKFDDEGYVGFSIYIPKNWKDELGTTGNRGSIMLYTSGTSDGASLMALHIYTPSNGNSSRWYMRIHTDDSSVNESVDARSWIDLGPVDPDKGKWTDFVVRYRANPFTKTTNPARQGIRQSMDKTFDGNRGIMQIWKAEGSVNSRGDRNMVLKHDVVNAPVGLVPGANDGETTLFQSIRAYKYKWQTEATSIKSTVWVGFDEFRTGQVISDRTRFEDVHPSGLACADGCAAGDESESRPAPPVLLSPVPQ